jgi:hypothetical protein
MLRRSEPLALLTFVITPKPPGVGWSLGEDLRCELVIDAFEMAWHSIHVTD